MQLDKLKKLAGVFALCVNTMAMAAEHDEHILNACPSLRPGAVETVEIPVGLDLSTNSWGNIPWLSGDIDSFSTANLVNSILFVPDATEPAGDLLLMINSPGGNLAEVETITTAMTMSPYGYVTTVCAAQASSSALAILAAGDRRLAFSNCHAIAHPTTHSLGDISRKDAEAYFKSIESPDDHYKRVLTQDGKNPQLDETCYDALDNNGDTRLSAMDLLHLRLVDGVLSPDNTSQRVLKSSPEFKFYSCIEDGEAAFNADMTDEARKEAEKALQEQCFHQAYAPAPQ